MRSLSQAVLFGEHPAVLERQERLLSVLDAMPINTRIPVPAYNPVCSRTAEVARGVRNEFLILPFSMIMEKKGGLYA